MKLGKNKLTVTVIVLSVAFIGLIAVTASKDTNGVSSTAGNALNPVQKMAYNVNRGVKDFVDFFLNFSTVKDENESLTKENEELKNKLLEYSDLEEENKTFREILNFKEQKENYNYIATNIIGYAGSGIMDGYIVDKGENDGITKNMVVISAEGLVGQVSSVGSNWAIIQSIINPNVNVSVMVQSTKENTGILKGYTNNSNENLVQVTNLPMDSNIAEGDVIITSGLGGLYPKEIPIGTVMSVEEDKVKVMKTAVVKPAVDFNKVEYLFIVAPKDTREIKYEE